MLDILTVVYSTPPKKPTGTHFSSTVDHGVSKMVSLIVQYRRAAYSPEFKPQHIKTTQCKMSNLSNLFLKNFQGVRLIQNFIGQAQRESRLTKAVEHQEIPQIQL